MKLGAGLAAWLAGAGASVAGCTRVAGDASAAGLRMEGTVCLLLLLVALLVVEGLWSMVGVGRTTYTCGECWAHTY